MAAAQSSWLASDGFRLFGREGHGASAEVFRALDSRGRTVALKVAAGDDVEARRALCREAAFAALAPSPGLAELLGAGWLVLDGDTASIVTRGAHLARPFIAFAWVEGQPASALAGKMSSTEVLGVARDVATALADLHALGVAHGDVKPDNVVVGERARLVDLGLAGNAWSRGIEGATPRYLARGDADLGDARARDVLALGVALAELSDGAVASAADGVAAARAARLPAPLDAICAALLVPSPGARPSAAWVAERAAGALDASTAEDDAERGARRVRATYLALRRGELATANEATEDAASWLAAAIDATRAARTILEPDQPGPGRALAALELEDRARWLTSLVGGAVAGWPLAALDDLRERDLADALESLGRRCPPDAWTFGLVEDATRARGHADDGAPRASAAGAGRLDATTSAELALAMAMVPVPAAAIQAIERADHPPPALARAAAEALRLAGQVGRARALLASAGDDPRSDALAADLLRRSGDLDAAERRAKEALARNGSDDRARAVLARMALDRGRLDDASAILDGRLGSPWLCEVAGLVAAARGETKEALRLVARGEAMGASSEQRARLAAVRGYVAHANDPEGAVEAFGAAVDHAVRSGAVVEEATYRTGQAAGAVGVGDLATALETSRRAALLWEHLGQPAMAARALLARAAAYAAAGATAETERAARAAIARASESGDGRAEAYALLAITDVLPVGDASARVAAERAAELLDGGGLDDQLWVGARALRHGVLVSRARIAELDAIASRVEVAAEPRLDWWGARAALLVSFADAGLDPAEAEAIVGALLSIAGARAAVASRARALHAGAELAARIGRGDAAQRLGAAQGEAARELGRRAPAELADSIRLLPWARRATEAAPAARSAEQARDLEALVRSFGDRERLGPLLNRVVDALVLWTGVERGLLLLRAPDGRLVPRAARNLARVDLTHEQLALSQSLARRALTAREPVVAVDAAGELGDLHASAHALRLRSVLAVPLLARGEALGVAYLDDRVRRGAFGERELEWVRTVAALAALAIADARDQVLLRRAARKARRAQAELAETLARREAALDVAERELMRARGERTTRFRYDAIVGKSPRLVDLLRVVDRVTQSDVPVLIYGQSGSGKELVARAIHHNGPRGAQPFVGENCGAIPEGLLESTLFGHVRGAFTGADRPRAGLFEVAHKGTLFLDEIGEMSLAMQTKLLRVLEDGDVRPVGSERSRKVDVRVVAATHRDLEAMVKAKTFREDLFYRLAILTLKIPSLAERSDDVPILVKFFLGKHGAPKTKVSPAAMDRLTSFAWPGNVRQLENEVRRALVLSDGTIEVDHLSPEIAGTTAAARADGLDMRSRIDALELSLVKDALARTSGNQTRAAKLLGLSRFGLQKMIKRLDIR